MEQLPPDVLDRWLAGAATAADSAQVDAWTGDDSVRRQQLNALRAATTRKFAWIPVSDARIARVKQVARAGGRRGEAKRPVLSRNATPSSGTSWRIVSATGVAAIALAVVAYGSRNTAPSGGRAEPSRRYVTGTARTAVVRLADGSRITLAPRTIVSITSDVNGRQVDLVGEARFDVAASSRTPFVVRAGAVTTRVLGTTFDVRRYAGERDGRISVQDGKVVTQSARVAVVLTAGMTGRFTDSLVVAATDSTEYTSWTSDELVFRDAPLPVVLASLERWYGYTFRLNDPTLSAEKVTAAFNIGDTPEMMRRLKRVLGVGLTFHDSVVTLQGRDSTNNARTETRVTRPARTNALAPIKDSHFTETGR